MRQIRQVMRLAIASGQSQRFIARNRAEIRPPVLGSVCILRDVWVSARGLGEDLSRMIREEGDVEG